MQVSKLALWQVRSTLATLRFTLNAYTAFVQYAGQDEEEGG